MSFISKVPEGGCAEVSRLQAFINLYLPPVQITAMQHIHARTTQVWPPADFRSFCA